MSTSNTDSRIFGVPLHEAVVALCIPLAMAVPAWTWGGLHPAYSGKMGVMALCLLAMLLVSPFFAARSYTQKLKLFRQIFGNLLRDRLLWAGVGFCLVWFLQYINVRSFETLAQVQDWKSLPVPFTFLPSAITRPEAGVSLFGGLLVLTIALAVRHGISTRAGLRLVLWGFVVQVLLMGLLSLYQLGVCLTPPYATRLYGGFYYQNHGGAYFYLGLFTLLGLTAYRLGRCIQKPERRHFIFWGGLVVFLSLVTMLTLSRVAVVLSIAALAAGTVYIVRKLPSSVPQVKKLKALMVLFGVGVFSAVLFSSRWLEPLRADLFQTRGGMGALELAYEGRAWQWRAALAMFMDHPFFGIGSQGFAYYIPDYAPPEHIGQLGKPFAGRVHNDLLEFLAELGLVGVIPLFWFFSQLVRPVMKKVVLQRGILVFPFAGTVVLLVHSFFDLPLRSPGIFAVFVMLTTILGQYAGSLEKVKYRKAG